jgi:protein SCO1/2
MTAVRGAVLSVLLLAAGTWGLYRATDGFQAFTTQTARTVEVRADPRPVPDAGVEDQTGARWALDDLVGRWLVVDFMYTRCTTLCSVMGSKFSQLQAQLAAPIAAGRVRLLSISFDPAHDAPAELAGYLTRFGERGGDWSAVRPTNAHALAALKRAFGITVIPDGLGGYTHNDGFGIVNPDGELVDIVGDDATSQAVAERVVRHLRKSPS